MMVNSILSPVSHLVNSASESIHGQFPNVTVFIGQQECGVGELYISRDQFLWVIGGDGVGFSLEYPVISLHGICKEVDSFPSRPCLYMLLDSDQVPWMKGRDDDDELAGSNEVRLCPENPDALQEMYSAVCECQAFHPEEEEPAFGDDGDEDDENGVEEDMEDDGTRVLDSNDMPAGDWYTGAAGQTIEMSAEGQRILDRIMAASTNDNDSTGPQVNGHGNGDSSNHHFGNGQFEHAD